MNDIEVLIKHKNDYDIAFGTKIYRPYSMSVEDWEVIENLLKERQSDKERIKHLSSVSDYETICLECNNLEEQLDIANDRIKELEEINEAHKKENGELREENTELKANHIFTHNEISDKEKAKLYDVIDSSIDKFIESSKPQWEQIMCKDKMTIEEAEEIIDNMYQDRNKILQKAGETETEVIFDVAKLDEVKFTNLEFASVRALREIQSLRRELERSIPKSLIEEKTEEADKKILEYEAYRETGKETDVEYYDFIASTAEKKVLEELLKGE